MILGISFRDEQDKRELIETAQNAKEAVCDLWEKMAEHMPELQQLQERNGRYRGGYGMGNMNGWNGNLGYRNYGGGSNYRGGYDMSGGYRGGYDMGGGYYREGNEPFGHFRENPAYTGGNDHRGY